jgi:hypothetical protein
MKIGSGRPANDARHKVFSSAKTRSASACRIRAMVQMSWPQRSRLRVACSAFRRRMRSERRLTGILERQERLPMKSLSQTAALVALAARSRRFAGRRRGSLDLADRPGDPQHPRSFASIRPRRRHRSISLTRRERPHAKRAIYSIAGDRLKICLALDLVVRSPSGHDQVDASFAISHPARDYARPPKRCT